jgi:hypothetical protein
MEIATRVRVWLKENPGDEDEKSGREIPIDVEFLPTTICTLVSAKGLIGHLTRSSQVLGWKKGDRRRRLEGRGSDSKGEDEGGCGRQVCAMDVHSVQPSRRTEDWHRRPRGPATVV